MSATDAARDAARDSARDDAVVFGQRVLGPILAEFCLRLWLVERFLAPDRSVLLFCARGGLRLQLVYERFLSRTGLPPNLPHAALMVSRLVAARTAFDPPSPGVLSELGREFSGRSMAEIAAALAQRDDLALPASWDAPFEEATFTALLAGNEPGVARLRAAVVQQDARFRAHLDACAGPARHCVLVDTGLYGSTVRMLQEGIPERTWSGLQFARCNYKRLATPHFRRTLGLSVESDWYKPWDARTSVLRFWHLIEACLEPDLPSVRTFSQPDPGSPPRANLQEEGWEARVAPARPDLFTGVLAHIERLRFEHVVTIPDDAARAWTDLKAAIIWPDDRAVATLSLGSRSRDFGRIELSAQYAAPRPSRPVQQIRDSLWREGALLRCFPRIGRFLLPVIEAVYAGRALHREALSRRQRKHEPALEMRSEPPLWRRQASGAN
ncbi:glycosyltransferase [Methylobacterium sp. NMS14P]|uniref:glycosyltransferase n=1 Tax=Methylobacterium sp. NMS14P TaxID=2894310 RepID=UPI0023596288|nr:glycosyltransferase [Methylobacterium sp. NMS14P]WCS24351.1 glycosyltransferase [Methylobacterium sp. NMS14P]